MPCKKLAEMIVLKLPDVIISLFNNIWINFFKFCSVSFHFRFHSYHVRINYFFGHKKQKFIVA